MAEQYPQNYPFPVYDDPYVNPPYPQREFSPTERTAAYISGLNPNGTSEYFDESSDQHQHYHRHTHGPPPLTIRRHTPGSNDPTLQRYPPNISPSGNVTSSSKVNVTIRRNAVPPDQSVVQPLLYPVAVYVNQPAPPPPPPVPPTIPYPVFQPIQYLQPIVEPLSKSISPNRYESESLTPPSRNKNTSPRRPVRLDQITPSPAPFEPQKYRPSRVVVEEFDAYNEEYRAPSVHTVPEKVISYRTAPGRTTREIQNEEIDHSERTEDHQSPPIQTITYRTSQN